MSLYNDPISDMLTRIRNASAIKRTQLSLPHSRLKEALARVLEQEGFLGSVEKKNDERGKPQLILMLNYSNDSARLPAIGGIERISKPGQRIYLSSKRIRPVRQGLGIAIISTPKGLMTDAAARKNSLGGEAICKIW